MFEFIKPLQELLDENNDSMPSISEKLADSSDTVTTFVVKQVVDARKEAVETSSKCTNKIRMPPASSIRSATT